MTPGEREEVARAMANAIDGTRPRVLHRQVVDRAIAPVIERMVAERVAAETERCAAIADTHKAAWARKHDAAKAASHIGEARDFQTMMIAAVTIDLAIRSATR